MSDPAEATERAAHDEVLQICRAPRHTPGAQWVMREAPSNPIPGYEWETRYRVQDVGSWQDKQPVAAGDTWLEVLNALPPEPAKRPNRY